MKGPVVILHASVIGRLSTPTAAPEDGAKGALPDGKLTDDKVDAFTGRLAAEAIARFHPTPDAKRRASARYLSGLFNEPVQPMDELGRKLNMRRAFVARLERA